MPEKPRISVHDYVDDRINEFEKEREARLLAFEEHMLRLLDRSAEKVRDEIHEARAWIILLTAASWGAIVHDEDPKKLVAAAVTLILVAAAIGYMLWVRRRQRQHADAYDAETARLRLEKEMDG